MQGKSITDVRLEVRLSKAYIIAIEDGHISVFRIRRFVRSYIRWLGMAPNRTLDILCAEIGFQYQLEKISFSKTNFSLRKRNSRSCCDRILVAGSLAWYRLKSIESL